MINMGTDSRPFWGYIRERNPVENEVVLKSENDNTKEDSEIYIFILQIYIFILKVQC